MKRTKFSCAAIALVLALWASNATALPGFSQIEKIHFDLVLGQQGLNSSNSAPGTYVSTINTLRITDQYLLNFLADAFHTNWPTGAQLALANFGTIMLIHETHIFVVDKTGTNLLFDATSGINCGGTNIAFFSFDYDNPIGAGKAVTSPLSLDETGWQIVSFKLYRLDDGGLTNDTDLSFQGLDISEGNYDRHTGTYSLIDHVSFYGDGSLNTTWSVVGGEMSGTLKWKKVPGL